MTLEAIGQKLKSAREAQGLSLRQIYERTKIPINHLQAIDVGQTDDLPEPVYVAGFIKRYAECIGLDGQVLADEYRRVDAPSNGNGNGHGGGHAVRGGKSASQPVYVQHEYLKHAKIDNRPPIYKLWPFYVVIALGLIIVVSWLSTQSATNNQQTDPSLASLKQNLSLAQQGNGANPAGNGLMPNAANPAAANPVGNPADDKMLTLSANKHVWVEVKRAGSGDTIYTGFLEQGDRRTYQIDDPQGIRVTAGNGASLSTEFKGKIEPFGEAGKKSERTFTSAVVSSSGSAAHGVTATGGTSSTSTASTSGTTNSTGSTTTAEAPKKKVQKTSSTTSATRRWKGEDQTRSIPGNDGMRSIDVPYRYSEGRLDSN